MAELTRSEVDVHLRFRRACKPTYLTAYGGDYT